MDIEVIAARKRHYLQAEAGSSLMDCLIKAGILEATECGGRGVCGKCAVKVHSGELALSEQDGAHTLPDGRILSCRAEVKEKVVVEIVCGQDDIRRKACLPGLQGKKRFFDTPVEKRLYQMTAPTLRDQASDLERLLAQTGPGKKVPLGVLKDLPAALREGDFTVTATFIDDELISVDPGDTLSHNYGFIVDVGTTTIAVYLADLGSGCVIRADGLANPQRPFGADVLTRISFAGNDEGLKKLQAVVLEGIGKAMRSMLREYCIDERHVYSLVAVGNTTMSQLFLGVDPTSLATAPFIPCYRSRVTLKAGRLGLPMNPEGVVHVLPNISGYVGSDTLGVAMATKLWEQKGYSLAVDIGTNGEILLSSKGWVLACSAAAGPAFEGAHIHNGMRAGKGAIETVRFENGGITLGIIGKTAPQGLCGSGLIDAAAELLFAGLLDSRGRLANDASPAVCSPLGSRLRTSGGMREFVLAFAGEHGNEHDIVITQKDIRELQLAKAAIAAGIAVLMQEMKIDASKIDRVFLAGAFGNYLDREKAVALGMFPGIPADKIIPVGNAAAEGAGMCLLSLGERKTADRIARFMKPIELSTRVDFNDQFVREIGFPPVVGANQAVEAPKE